MLTRGRGFFGLTVRRAPTPTSVLLVASFGAFLAFLDSTIVNIAFPDIQAAFPTYDLGSLSWILNSYNIVFAAFLVASGRIADVLGRKKTFIFGVVIFTIASGLCAIATNVELLVAFRVLQGIGSAILVPASLALIVEGFEPSRRAHAVGLWGAAAAIASGLGPPIGGMLVEAANWRWVFLVNVPLGIVAVIISGRVLVESRASGRRRVPDLRGAILLGAAVGLMTLGLIKGPEWGWLTVETIGSFVGSVVMLAGFVWSSRNHKVPLVDPAYLKIRSFVVGNILTLIGGAGFYCYVLTHVLFLAYIWHYSLLKAGFAIAPAAVIAAVVAAVLGKIADKHGHRWIVAFGGLMWAGSLVWYLMRVGSEPDFLGAWLPGQILQGIGVGATMPVLGSAALAGIAKGGSYATASAVVSTTRQLGAVVGVAVLVILIGKPELGAGEELLRRGWTMAAICFVVVGIGAVLLGKTTKAAEAVGPEDDLTRPILTPHHRHVPKPVLPAPKATGDADLLADVELFAGLDAYALRELRQRADDVELEAGAYLFHEGDASDALYVVRSGRLQALQGDIVLRELGRGEVIGELGLLVSAPRSASIRAMRDSTLVRLTKSQFDRIADRGVLAALVKSLGTRLHQAPPPAVPRPVSAGVVVAVVGVGNDAPVRSVASALLNALSTHVSAVDPGRVDRDGLDRAEQVAEKVVLNAAVNDGAWRDFCLRVADRIVLVAGNPSPTMAQLPSRAAGADIVLAGPPATQEDRRLWEALLKPKSVHAVGHRTVAEDIRPLARRLTGRSIGLVLGGGGARAFAHIGVLEELERAGIVVDRFAGTSMGAVIAACPAAGLNAQATDAQLYEYFCRRKPLGDYTFPAKGVIRGKRGLNTLIEAYEGLLVEELKNEFRCVSVDLLARKAVTHRSGSVAYAVACSSRLPGLYPPLVYDGGLHVDGAVLDNLPVTALAGPEGPVIAVHIGFGAGPENTSQNGEGLRVPGIADTLMRTTMMGSGNATDAALKRADVVLRADTRAVGLLEFHQIDVAREAGRAAAREVLPQLMEVASR